MSKLARSLRTLSETSSESFSESLSESLSESSSETNSRRTSFLNGAEKCRSLPNESLQKPTFLGFLKPIGFDRFLSAYVGFCSPGPEWSGDVSYSSASRPALAVHWLRRPHSPGLAGLCWKQIGSFIPIQSALNGPSLVRILFALSQ